MQADYAVEINGNAYSVPWRLIGETVRATIMDGTVRIYHGSQRGSPRGLRQPRATRG